MLAAIVAPVLTWIWLLTWTVFSMYEPIFMNMLPLTIGVFGFTPALTAMPRTIFNCLLTMVLGRTETEFL